MQLIDGEEWPPSVSEADVQMSYPPGVPKHKQFALGHEFFSLLPGTAVEYLLALVAYYIRVKTTDKDKQAIWNAGISKVIVNVYIYFFEFTSYQLC